MASWLGKAMRPPRWPQSSSRPPSGSSTSRLPRSNPPLPVRAVAAAPVRPSSWRNDPRWCRCRPFRRRRCAGRRPPGPRRIVVGVTHDHARVGRSPVGSPGRALRRRDAGRRDRVHGPVPGADHVRRGIHRRADRVRQRSVHAAQRVVRRATRAATFDSCPSDCDARRSDDCSRGRHERADLLVLGHQGARARTSMARSISKGCVRGAACPVVVVRESFRRPRSRHHRSAVFSLRSADSATPWVPTQRTRSRFEFRRRLR